MCEQPRAISNFSSSNCFDEGGDNRIRPHLPAPVAKAWANRNKDRGSYQLPYDLKAV